MSTDVQLLECSACAAALDAANIRNGICKCKYCGYNNILPRNDTSNEVVSLLCQGDGELRVGDFERAYNAYLRASELSPKESRAYFGMALSENRIKYIKDVVNNCYRPICFAASERRFDSDKNLTLALEYAYNDDQHEEYATRAREIDYIRAKFASLKRSGLRYDTFICTKVSDGNGGFTQDSVWAGKLYDAIKRNGFNPFFSERDIADRVGEDYEALILYALCEAKSMIIVCSNEDYLRTPWVQNEYSRYCDMMTDNEKESGSIIIAFNGQPIERIPGMRGKIQGVDLGSFDASQRICEFVKKFTEPEEARTKLCVACGAECDESLKLCPECGSAKFAKDKDELARIRESLDKETAEDSEEKKAKERERRADQIRVLDERRIRESLTSNYTKMNFTVNGTVLEKYIGTDIEVEIPYGISEIGKDAFHGKKKIEKINLPETLSVIGKNAFWGCRSLTEIEIPPAVSRIEKDAFFDCASLKKVIVSDIDAWCGICFENSAANPVYYSKCIYHKDKVLARLEFPEGSTEIKPFSFIHCYSLVSVTVPETVSVIGKDAFYGCEKLVDVVNKSSVLSKPGDINTSWLTFYASAVSTTWTSICEQDGFLFHTKKGVAYLVGYEGDMTDIRLPESFDGKPYDIYKFAFFRNSNLVSVTVPKGIVNADKGAFEGCGGIEIRILGERGKSGLAQGFHKKSIDNEAKII